MTIKKTKTKTKQAKGQFPLTIRVPRNSTIAKRLMEICKTKGFSSLSNGVLAFAEKYMEPWANSQEQITQINTDAA